MTDPSELHDRPELPFSPAADRNKQPILDVLLKMLPGSGSALEIASGTGQHACWFAAAMLAWTWQPTDSDPAALPIISARLNLAGLPNVRQPFHLDVLVDRWLADGDDFEQPFDAIFCANLLHISPWITCAAVMHGAARHLAATGLLLTYGPYLEQGVPTAPGNLTFDADLRARNPAWGIRSLSEVAAEAGRAGLQLRERHPLPANNLLLAWAKKPV